MLRPSGFSNAKSAVDVFTEEYPGFKSIEVE